MRPKRWRRRCDRTRRWCRSCTPTTKWERFSPWRPSALTRSRNILLHTDAAQSAGKIAVDVDALGVDLLTLAGHKFYAPKGVGALYVRAGTPIRAITFGADQERGLRPGTENVPAIVGLGVAARLARERLPEAAVQLRLLRDRLYARLAAAIPDLGAVRSSR